MHELSAAQEILNIINQHLPEQNSGSIKTIKVKAGKLSNILPDSLTFCFKALVSETPFQNVKLEITEIPLKILCNNCNKESEIDLPVFACPGCKSNRIKIISGTELLVDEIELLDNVPEEK